jgi:hypothetical protein
MKTITIVASLLALVFLVSASPAHAQGPCRPDLVCAEDMAGLYISPESLMRVTIFPTGVVHLLWQNEYGMHEQWYRATERLAGGGYITDAIGGGPGLDGRGSLGVKPAERGTVQLFTMSPFMTDLQVYPLIKIE